MHIAKALVVDDSKVAHLTLRKLLAERSVEVDWVGSGEEALTYMSRQRPDIIFMDVMMPGMDGFETASAITTSKTTNSPPPIIMCSANATDEDKQDAKDSGAIAFLSKPYTPQQMDQILEMVRGLPTPAGVQPPATAAQSKTSNVSEAAAVEVPKTPSVAKPQTATTEGSEAAAPSGQGAAPAFSTGDLERLAERAAWSMADKVARDVATDIAKSKAEQIARAIAEETARGMAEEAGRKAAQAAVQAAQEAAKKVAIETARRAATEVAQESAEKAARAIAGEVSEEVTKKNLNRGLTVIRDDLAKSLEQQVARSVQDTMARTVAGQDFKQQLMHILTESVLPTAEAAARQAATEAAHEALVELAGVRKRAGFALLLSIVAILAALGVGAVILLL
jgi:CheY-like chemotaxis protein